MLPFSHWKLYSFVWLFPSAPVSSPSCTAWNSYRERHGVPSSLLNNQKGWVSSTLDWRGTSLLGQTVGSRGQMTAKNWIAPLGISGTHHQLLLTLQQALHSCTWSQIPASMKRENIFTALTQYNSPQRMITNELKFKQMQKGSRKSSLNQEAANTFCRAVPGQTQCLSSAYSWGFSLLLVSTVGAACAFPWRNPEHMVLGGIFFLLFDGNCIGVWYT